MLPDPELHNQLLIKQRQHLSDLHKKQLFLLLQVFLHLLQDMLPLQMDLPEQQMHSLLQQLLPDHSHLLQNQWPLQQRLYPYPDLLRS